MADDTLETLNKILDEMSPKFEITHTLVSAIRDEYAERGAVAVDTVLIRLSQAIIRIEMRLHDVESNMAQSVHDS